MLTILSELRNNKVVPVLYEDDEEIMVIPKKIINGKEYMDIPERYLKMLDKQADEMGEEDEDEIDLVPEPTPFNNYASMMNRRAMTTPDKKISYVERDDPQSRMKPSPKPKPPKQFATFKTLKHMNEEETDILVQQITDNVLNRIKEREEEVPVQKGFLRMLLGATGLNELLSNRNKEERKRLQAEFDRAYYKNRKSR